jgi:hypothetical protein
MLMKLHKRLKGTFQKNKSKKESHFNTHTHTQADDDDDGRCRSVNTFNVSYQMERNKIKC